MRKLARNPRATLSPRDDMRVANYLTRNIRPQPFNVEDDWDSLYERYITTSNCELCGVELIAGKKSNSRSLDHDHSITDSDNVRYVLCHRCNSNHDRKPMDWKQRKEYNKKYKKALYAYRTSWGGNLKGDNCNLLKIDISIFT